MPTTVVNSYSTATGHWQDTGDGFFRIVPLTPEERAERSSFHRSLCEAWAQPDQLPYTDEKYGDDAPNSMQFAPHRLPHVYEFEHGGDRSRWMRHMAPKTWMSKADLLALSDLFDGWETRRPARK